MKIRELAKSKTSISESRSHRYFIQEFPETQDSGEAGSYYSTRIRVDKLEESQLFPETTHSFCYNQTENHYDVPYSFSVCGHENYETVHERPVKYQGSQ